MTAAVLPRERTARVATTSTCAATVRCNNEPAPGLMVCRGHLERLSAMLREIGQEAAILSAVPSMQQKAGRGSSPAAERSPARLDVIAFRDPQTRRWTRDEQPRYTPPAPKSYGPWCLFCEHETCVAWRAGRQRDLHDDEYDAGSDRLMSILNVLHGWARCVREERQLSTPDRVTVTGEIATLTFHREWLAEQFWIDEFYSEISELAVALKNLNGHRPERPYSKCPRDVDGQLCSGDVWVQDEMQVVWRRYSDRCAKTWEQAPGAAVCDTCGASWVTEGDKARLKLMVESAAAELARPRTDDGRAMLTAEEIVARGLVSSISNVRVQAHRRGVVSRDGYYDPEWFVKATA